MNSGPLLFLGLFVSMAVSWAAFILAPQLQLGNLEPAKTVSVTSVPVDYPNNLPGMARQGAEVYRASGCAYCHTEQVRPANLGSDLARGWGIRRSVAHDYIFDQTLLLGDQRIGPDLANAGSRMDANAVLARLWDPRNPQPGSIMPPYRYLFDVRKIGRAPSTNALVVPPQFAAPAGYEIIPRPPALALAAYVANLRQDNYLFEVPPPPSAIPAGTNAPGTNAAPANPTNAPAK
ncbi:MAG: cbb3-type cytochrome c oxidase subunit II [Verrucomicrobiota bacterium]|jgi:cytochrome c oxidase cbb3-type subunit 2